MKGCLTTRVYAVLQLVILLLLDCYKAKYLNTHTNSLLDVILNKSVKFTMEVVAACKLALFIIVAQIFNLFLLRLYKH